MLFRDDTCSIFPRKSVTTREIIEAKENAQKMKLQRTDEMNESKYKKQDEIEIGDRILLETIRNNTNLIHSFYHNHIVISTNKNYVAVQNEFDRGVLNRQG